MVSVGVYNYDADGDGSYDEGDIIIDARDIQNLAEAVDTLNSEYTTAIAQLSANKFALVKAMDATVTAKNKILADGATDADDISFDSIISTISNLQTPSTATASYYAGGSNGDNSTNGYLASSGSTATSSSVSSGTATINLNTSGASDLTLGVNEQITLESGYYSDPVTVSNGVVNRGTLDFNPSSQTSQTIEAGYYEGGTLSTTNAYDSGYKNGNTEGYTNGYNAASTQLTQGLIPLLAVHGYATREGSFSQSDISFTAQFNGTVTARIEFKNDNTIGGYAAGEVKCGDVTTGTLLTNGGASSGTIRITKGQTVTMHITTESIPIWAHYHAYLYLTWSAE